MNSIPRALAAALVFSFLPALAAAQTDDTPPPAFERPRGSDRNPILAGVGKIAITQLDLEREWSLRRAENAELKERPPAEMSMNVLREIVREYLWIERAKAEYPTYSEFVTERQIEDQGRDLYRQRWDEPMDPELHKILRRKTESYIAQSILLHNDSPLVRAITPIPEDVRRYYRTHPDEFVEKEQVRLGQLLLPRNVFGPETEGLAERIRAKCRDEGRRLEQAADELAPGYYKLLDWEDPTSSGRRKDLLDFAQDARTADISPTLSTPSAVQLFELVDRQPRRVVPFEEAAESIREMLRRRGWEQQSLRFFLLEVLPFGDFFPKQLFDDELRSLGLR